MQGAYEFSLGSSDSTYVVQKKRWRRFLRCVKTNTYSSRRTLNSYHLLVSIEESSSVRRPAIGLLFCIMCYLNVYDTSMPANAQIVIEYLTRAVNFEALNPKLAQIIFSNTNNNLCEGLLKQLKSKLKQAKSIINNVKSARY